MQRFVAFAIASIALVSNAFAVQEPAFRPVGVNAQGMALFERPRDGARVVWLPAGSFRMNGYFPRPVDDPEHEWVHVDAFGIDEAEVTNRQFARFLNETRVSVDSDGRTLLHEVASGVHRLENTWAPEPGCDELPALAARWESPVSVTA